MCSSTLGAWSDSGGGATGSASSSVVVVEKIGLGNVDFVVLEVDPSMLAPSRELALAW